MADKIYIYDLSEDQLALVKKKKLPSLLEKELDGSVSVKRFRFNPDS